MPADQGIVDSVSNDNMKTVADAGAHSIAVLNESMSHSLTLSMQNAVSHQNRMNVLAEGAVAQALKGFQEMDPVEALSLVKGLTGNDVAQQLSTLGAAIAQIQQIIKGAQTTPPPTA